MPAQISPKESGDSETFRRWAVVRDDLAAQVRRYLPVGQIPQFITEREEEGAP